MGSSGGHWSQGGTYVQGVKLQHKRVHNLVSYPTCIPAGVYPYMEDLQWMETCTMTAGLNLLSKLATVSITSPFQQKVWKEALRDHPDQRFRNYIVTSLRDRFRIGFQGIRSCQPVTKNISSAEEKVDVISRYLQEECASRRVLGQLNKDFSNLGVMVNGRFGVIRPAPIILEILPIILSRISQKFFPLFF